jgi:beta-glucosidase
MKDKKWLLVLSLLLLAGMRLHADEEGSGGCGKLFVVQGEVKHLSPRSPAVKGATHPEMYTQEIYGKEFSAYVEGLPEGKYTVEVYLAETYHTAAGNRIFSISSGNDVLAKDLDLFSLAGPSTEYVVRGTVYHQADSINGPLTLTFQSTVDMAKFNAIIIRDAGNNVVACVKAVELKKKSRDYPIPQISDPVVYTDPDQPVEKRVADLVRRMSVTEKVGQLQNSAQGISRLGVPAYDYWNECLHGVARAGNATVFPQAIGLAAMWDDQFMRTLADTIATEGRAKNNAARAKNPNTARYYGLTFWTPNINIFRDPRWGRGQETYGEDPYLTAELGVAFIQGLQGDDPDYYKAIACAKHFAVHSGPEKLRHSFDARPSRRDLYETYLPQFEAAVKRGKVANVMSAYNAIDGIPAPAQTFFLTELLRNQWGFDGHVVSDCGGIHDVWKYHKYAADEASASAVCLKAGNDLECGGTYKALVPALSRGLITEGDLDRALSRVLDARFRLGLFDPPEKCAYLKIPGSANDTAANSELALNAARRSIVLLKNNGVLPLQADRLKRIAVIGPNAASLNALLGNYYGEPSSYATVLDGLKKEAEGRFDVGYAKGCPLALKPKETYSVDGPDGQEALALAAGADLVIYVGGLDAKLEGEEMKTSYQGFDRGDRIAIDLPSPQNDLLKALESTGKPVVFVNMSGSAIAMPWADEHLDAIIQLWYPGQNGGTAAADVLFGKVNPAGRLPVTFYRSVDDLPDFLDYSMANRTYRYFKGKPLYAFGHGLSYTVFDYSKLKTSAKKMAPDGSVKVRVNVTNRGPSAGDEVVQLYVKHLSSPVSQPKHSLAGFKRVAFAKGETKTVEFILPASALRYWDEQKNEYTVPFGPYEIQAGGASDVIRLTATVEVAPAEHLGEL